MTDIGDYPGTTTSYNMPDYTQPSLVSPTSLFFFKGNEFNEEVDNNTTNFS